MKVFKKALAATAAVLIGVTNICSIDTQPLICNTDTVNAVTYSDDMQYGDLYYKQVDEDKNGSYDYIEISDCDESAETVDIPAEIDGLPIKSIGDRAFEDCSSLTSINIPNSVTSIGEYAFYKCKNLTSIKIPNSVTSIGDCAFDSCSSLTSMEIPDSVTSIGVWVFGHCSGLTSIIIPNSITSIGYSAFLGCSGLISIELPNSVTSIGNLAFNECSALTSITIENPECEIYDGKPTISNGLNDNGDFCYNGVIRGYENSTAKAYAEKYDRKFESLGENPTEPTEPVSGDIDGNGKADLYDAIIVCKCMISAKDVTEEQKKNADVNGDGYINLYDAIYVAECMIGKHK